MMNSFARLFGLTVMIIAVIIFLLDPLKVFTSTIFLYLIGLGTFLIWKE